MNADCPSHESPAAFGLRGILFCTLLPCGFAYVAMALCGRATPFESGDNRWNDFLGVTLSGPAIFLLATRHTLLAFRPRPRRAFLWNGAGFTLPFVAGLHWEYLGRLSGANFSLTTQQLTHLNLPSRIALGIGLAIAVGMTSWCLRTALREGFLARYAGSFAALLGLLWATGEALGPRYYLHLHHYFWSLCLLPWLRFRHPLCLVLQGLLAGVYVEGASRYGMSPLWSAALSRKPDSARRCSANYAEDHAASSQVA